MLGDATAGGYTAGLLWSVCTLGARSTRARDDDACGGCDVWGLTRACGLVVVNVVISSCLLV